MAWDVDMVVSDAIKMNTGYGTDPKDEVKPGIIIASNNLAANDAVAVALMRYHDTARLDELTTRKHKQLQLANRYGLGSSNLSSMEIKTSDLVQDPDFEDVIAWIEKELED